MGHSVTHESEDGVLSTDSHLSKDGDNFGGSSNGGIVFKKGPWTPAEDAILVEYVKKHGEGNWNAIQKLSGLLRCGKSCRLRWANHLRPNLKKGAFTSEEERLIIELHVKMGNKWARMAAHLPGRTDNEIKNYWNTRIKKCQRSGQPIYPPELCSQAQPENQESLSYPGICDGDKGCHDILQTGGHKAQDVMLNSLNIFPYTEEFPDISDSGFLINGFHCSPFHTIPGIMGWRKNTQNPNELILGYGGGAAGMPSFDSVHTDYCGDQVSQSFTPYFPYHPANTEQLLPIGINQDSHFMSNGFFSASKPFAGAEKMELPSLQHEEIGLGVWDTAPESMDSFLYSSIAVPLPLDCPSPRNSGLLEALLDEAKALRKSPDNALSSFFSTGYVTECSAVETCSPKLKGFIDFSSPLSKSIGSLFNECTPSYVVGSSSEMMPEAVDENWMLDGVSNEIFNQLYCSRPDVVLRSSPWLEQSGSALK